MEVIQIDMVKTKGFKGRIYRTILSGRLWAVMVKKSFNLQKGEMIIEE